MVCSSTVNWSWGSVRSIEVFAESHGWGMYILQSPVHQPSLLFKVLWKAKGKFQPFLHCMHAPCMFRFSVHAHMCVPSFDDGCTSHLFGSYLNFKDNFCIKSLQKIWKLWKHSSKIQNFWFMTTKYLNQEYLSFLKSGQYVWSQICGVRPAQNVLATAHLFYKSIWRRICNRLSHLCTLWLSRIIVLKFTGIESDIKNRVISRK